MLDKNIWAALVALALGAVPALATDHKVAAVKAVKAADCPHEEAVEVQVVKVVKAAPVKVVKVQEVQEVQEVRLVKAAPAKVVKADAHGHAADVEVQVRRGLFGRNNLKVKVRN